MARGLSSAGPRAAARNPHARTVLSTPNSDGTFSSLAIRNYRLYFGGQAVSLVGTWMQALAMSWLALELTHSGTAIGLVLAARSLPILLLGAYGGLVADRVAKRPLLLATQTAFAILALALGLLAATGTVRLWMVFVFAALFGTIHAVDMPARQAFVVEMVGARHVQNAVSLNSVLINSSRAVGPAFAGALIATVGVGVCFLVNAASFVAVIAALALMRPGELHPAPPVARERGQVRAGLRYVRETPGLRTPLIMMALIGTLAYEFPVVLPLFAERVLDGGADVFGMLTSAMGLGAVAGGLLVATAGVTGLAPLTTSAAAFGGAILLAALVPTLPGTLVAFALVGAASTAFMATCSSTLQLTTDGRFRGRVMALWAIMFQGSTPIGGPVLGGVCELASPRYALAVGALACLAAALIGARAVRRIPPEERSAPRPAQLGWAASEPPHST